MRTVNEGTGLEFTARFYDALDAPSIPANAYWRLDCQATGRELQGWTEETPTVAYDEFGEPLDVSIYVEVDAALNAIQDESNRHEVKELTVASGYNTSRQVTETVLYDVKNRRRR